MKAPRPDALEWKGDRGGRGAVRAVVDVGGFTINLTIHGSRQRRGGPLGNCHWELWCGVHPFPSAVELHGPHGETLEAAKAGACAEVPRVVRAARALTIRGAS